MKLFILIYAFSVSVFAAESGQIHVPEFETQIKISKGSVSLIALPPKGNHFNIKAPSTVEMIQNGISRKMSFKMKKESHFEVHLLEKEIRNGQDARLKVVLFLCDDANTYCVRQQKVVSIQK